MAKKDNKMKESAKSELETYTNRNEWWIKYAPLRWLNYIPLRAVDRDYAKWRKSNFSPRRFRKIQQQLDRMYPPEKFSAKQLIGREKEYNLLLDSFRLHVLKHPMLKKWFHKDELPKAICLTGESGTGKELVALEIHRSFLRDMKRYMPQKVSG